VVAGPAADARHRLATGLASGTSVVVIVAVIVAVVKNMLPEIVVTSPEIVVASADRITVEVTVGITIFPIFVVNTAVVFEQQSGSACCLQQNVPGFGWSLQACTAQGVACFPIPHHKLGFPLLRRR